MNIYLFELKTQLRSIISWGIAFILLAYAFLKGLYPMFADAATQIMEMLKGMPEGFVKAFGFDIDSMFEFGGFYGFIFGYLSVAGAIMAVIVAVAIFSREKRGKCMDFIITKPISRHKIFVSKFLSGLTILTITNILYIGTLILFEADTKKEFVLSMFSLYFTQLVFYAIGILIAVLLKRIRSVSGVGTAAGIVGFALTAIVSLLEKEKLLIIAPLKYFDPANIYATGSYTAKYVICAIIIFVVCMAVSFTKYCKSDIDAI